MTFKSCEVMDDLALSKFQYARGSLEEVVFIFCPTITDLGLSYLYLLK